MLTASAGRSLKNLFGCCRLQIVLENAVDLIVDIPKLWSYLGEIVGPVVQVTGLSFLEPAIEPLRTLNMSCGAFVAAVLSSAARDVVRNVLILHVLCFAFLCR
jgi:hypothetical protein